LHTSTILDIVPQLIDRRNAMQQNIASLAGLVLAILLLALPTPAAAGSPPAVGGPLPAITLPVPENAAARSYLQVPGRGEFTVPRIKADVVIVEIFSMYCPYCQAEAPVLNALYAKIEGTSALKGRVKIIGIGVGNSPFEVDTFRKKYAIPFPLFADGDFIVHRLVGEVRTPYFIVVRNSADGSHRVIYSKLGRITGVDEFLAEITKLAALK
jgi:thiol-disulfide isomerase/thioredoxin